MVDRRNQQVARDRGRPDDSNAGGIDGRRRECRESWGVRSSRRAANRLGQQQQTHQQECKERRSNSQPAAHR